MIRAPQQTGVHRVAAPNGVHFVDKADRLGRLVDDPGVSRGFYLAKIGDVVVVRQVNHQRVDLDGLQFATAFHPLPPTPAPRWAPQKRTPSTVRAWGGRSHQTGFPPSRSIGRY